MPMGLHRLSPSYKVRPDRAIRCQDNASVGFPGGLRRSARHTDTVGGEDTRGAAAVGTGSAGIGRMSFGLGGVAGDGAQALKQSAPAHTAMGTSERRIG